MERDHLEPRLSEWRRYQLLAEFVSGIANNTVTGNTASWLRDMPVPVGGGGIFATADDLDGRPHPTAVSAPVIINNVVAANGGWLGGGDRSGGFQRRHSQRDQQHHRGQ